MLGSISCGIEALQNVVASSVVIFNLDFRPGLPEWWSPSSYNRLHACAYRFALSSDTRIFSKFAKPNTFAALGTASHRLTERAWSNEFALVENAELDQKLNEAWDQEVAIQLRQMQAAWSPSQVPPPQDWPYYSINSRRSIRRIKNEIIAFRERGGERRNPDGPWVEHEIQDEDSQLKGTPDRVIFFDEHFIIQDLKTGFKVKEMSDSHRRQLLLYAHLVRSDTGKIPHKIEVIKADGQVLEEAISDSDVDGCVNEFKKRTQEFANLVRSGQVDISIASPSPEVCGHCHYRPVCERFWTDTNFDWGDTRGIVGRVAQVGDSTTLTIEQIYPSDGAGDVLGLSNIHHSFMVGDIVSVVNAYRQGMSLRGRWNTVSTTLCSDV